VHAPAQVDVEDLDEVVAALAVVVAADRGQQRRHVDVGAHDGVEHPLQPEVRHALEAHLERVDARDGHGARGRHALAGEQAEERRLAGAIGYVKCELRPCAAMKASYLQ
jgi:hypothetical protein